MNQGGGHVSARFRAYMFETWIGLLTIYTAALYSVPGNISPTVVATKQAFGAVAWVWLAQYALAGVLLLVGVARASVGLHGAGLVLLAGGALVNAVAQVIVYGPVIAIALAAQIVTVVFSLWRLRRMLKGERNGVFILEDRE